MCRCPGPVDASRALGKAKQVHFLLQSLQSLLPSLAPVMAECCGVLPVPLQLGAGPGCLRGGCLESPGLSTRRLGAGLAAPRA